MTRRPYCFAFVILCFFSYGAAAQQWLSALPPSERANPTFETLRQAFERHYREHPIDLTEDKLKPTFEFEGEEEENERIEVEEYKMFRRWEWLVEPRAFPSGRLNLEQIAAFRKAVRGADEALVARQGAAFNSLLEQKSWEALGPFDAVGGANMGRVNCVEVDPKNANIIYLCSADGGVWKSTDGGATWAPKFDTQLTLSVGDIAIDHKNTNVVYVATSDSYGYGVPFWGGTYSVGVMKSIDGGTTWAETGLKWGVEQNRTIRRLVMHPSDPRILLAATSDGVYRTADGGATWKQIVPESAYDVEFQQDNGAIVYATTKQALKSADAGASFSPLAATCGGHRFSIEIARSNPKTLYTLCTNGVVQKSVDAGASWKTVTVPGVKLYGYYDNVLAVSPVNPNVVYVAGFDMKRSTDGGATWSEAPQAAHPDNHTIKFARGSGSTIFCGNDGGLFKSTDSGATWKSLNKGLSITQFYGLGISKADPNIMVAGAQDNGNMKVVSGRFSNITNADGMRGFIDWSDSNVIYASIQKGGFYRSDDGGVTFTSIATPAEGSWVSPWRQDPVDAKTLYAGTDKVYKSLDKGATWAALGGALPGVPLVTMLTVAPSDSKVIYAGGRGKLYRTVNSGEAWADVTAGLPVGTNFLTSVAISDANPDIAYATFSGYVAGEKVYRTLDGGATWTNFSGSLPNMPVNAIVFQKDANNAVYVGTDAGVYYRNDALADWVPYKTALPNVIVDDLQIHEGSKTILAATFGRGIWQAPLF
jgi:photosystem II stability/assembly factor-like uncharacterized protein